MKIFIDIGHPAHIHYFKHLIKILGDKRHTFFVSARDRGMVKELLDHYKIEYYNRGKGKTGIIGKLWYMLVADLRLLLKSIKFKPDLFLSFGSPYNAQVASMLRKPAITMDDTEHAKFGHAMYKPFTSVFLNPVNFNKSFGAKQIFFRSYIELSYLHPNYFVPDSGILRELGLKNDEKFCILRFVSWEANHDIGHTGLSNADKVRLVMLLKKKYRVFVSSEGEYPAEIAEYAFRLPPHKMHDALAFADLFIGEGATMASECAMLGTPAIYINSIVCETLNEQEKKYGLVHNFHSTVGFFEKVEELISVSNLKEEQVAKRNKMLAEKIDVTAFMVWFIENYPESARIMKENPAYQNRFK